MFDVIWQIFFLLVPQFISECSGIEIRTTIAILKVQIKLISVIN